MTTWITTEQAVEITGYSACSLRSMKYRYQHFNFPKSRKNGRYLEWPLEDLQRWIKENPPELRKQRSREQAAATRIAGNDKRAEQNNIISPFNAACMKFMRGDYDADWKRS